MQLTPNALSNKISELVKEGYPQKQAIAIAYTAMRIAWRDKHPKGKFPVWLHTETRGKNPISEKTAHKLRKASPRTFMKMTDEEIKRAVKVKKNPVKTSGGFWKVYLNGKMIDKVWYTSGHTAYDVKTSLVNKDGYSPLITVRKETVRKNPVRPLKKKPYGKYIVETSLDKKHWTIIQRFNDELAAFAYAKLQGQTHPYQFVRVRK